MIALRYVTLSYYIIFIHVCSHSPNDHIWTTFLLRNFIL